MPYSTTVASATRGYLERALRTLAEFGLMAKDPIQAPVVALIERAALGDDARAMLIAQTLQRESEFNDAVRNNIAGAQIANRYADIVSAFDSIRSDLETMATFMADDKISASEAARLFWMRIRRGTIHDRFDRIRGTFLDVARDAGEQIKVETGIVSAYLDFRMAMKEAEMNAQELLAEATVRVQQLDDRIAGAQASVASAQEGAVRARLELERDEAIRARAEEDARYQIVKDLADNMRVGYNTSELVYARLQQNITAKDRVHQQAVTFFATNEKVLTGLEATLTSQQGLGELTNTQKAMTHVTEQALDLLATTGSTQLEEATRVGYGPTVRADAVAKLANAVEEWQRSSVTLIESCRAESTENAKQIQDLTEGAKQRFSAIAGGARA